MKYTMGKTDETMKREVCVKINYHNFYYVPKMRLDKY